MHGRGLGQAANCTPEALPLPFTVDFFGSSYSSLYLNNNGNLTFDHPLSTYTPYPLSHQGDPIIAPFFADVDTRSGNTVTFGTGTVGGHKAFGVNWPGVGCFAQITRVLNDFQVLLVTRADIAPGDFTVEFNYDQIQWTSGRASTGNATCHTGTAARAGFASGSGETGSYYELPGSGIDGALLDSNETTGLVHNDAGSSQLGRYVYSFRDGEPDVTLGAPASGIGEGVGRGNGTNAATTAVHNPTCTHTDPVNCASGDFHETATDLSIPGPGPSLDLTRTYNSLNAVTKGIFGYGWASSYSMHLTPASTGAVTITAGDGSSVTAVPDGAGTYQLPTWADSTLTSTGGVYTFVRHQTETFTFDSTGELTEISDPNGLTTTLSYSTGRLTTVTSPAAKTLTFTYGTNGLVSTVSGPATETVW